MELFIRLKNGQPFEHPISADNVKLSFPEIDFNNLPDYFAPFVRVASPELGVYEVLVSETSTYEIENGVCRDVWVTRNMTDVEKSKLQENTKKQWASQSDNANFTAWTFDEATCSYLPPTPRPNNGNFFWQGTTSSWVETPQYPDDGKSYKLDIDSATWVEIN
jgi:hypothetical protein